MASDPVAAADAAHGAADAILTLDGRGKVHYANPAAVDLFAIDDLIDIGLGELVALSGGRDLVDLLGPSRVRVLAECTACDTELFEVELSIAPTEEEGKRWVVIIHPLPRQELSVRELLRRATHDDLTGLANRGYLFERIEATFRDPRTANLPHTLVMFDLDRFKQFNDSWGHDAGDAILLAVGTRLRGMCRPGDIVARLGGDEFAAWCRNVDDNHVAGLVKRLATIFDLPVIFHDLELSVDGSIGATTTTFARQANNLLRQADAAMYRAKAAGPGRQVVFDRFMAAELRERGTRERELRNALNQNEFVLHFQPVVDLRIDRVIGVEALARWEHPRLGQLQPADFLPLVESTLLGDEFDSRMIELACRQLAAWRGRDTELSMWINVSPNHLDPSLVDELLGHIQSLDLRSQDIVLELTEEATVATPERIAVLESIHELGVRIAVDDFGTGYSQLSYLPDLPIDLVKLDRSFVQGIAIEPERQSLAGSVIALAHALHAEVVAEGVEQLEDLRVIRRLGCDHAQGFLLARPSPPDEIVGLDLRESDVGGQVVIELG